MAACRQSTISIRWINSNEQNRAVARFANVCCDFESSYSGEITIILYGSYARREETAQSDVDIVAIVRGDRIDLQKKLRVIWEASAEIGLENDVVVSPTVVPLDEFEFYKNSLPYYMNIEKEGIKVG